MTPAQVLALDPLLIDVDWGVVGIVVLKVVVAFTLLLVSVLFMVWFERKAVSDLQNRIGPNRAGPFGLFQTIADGLKFFMKEDSIPDRADRRVFVLAPYLAAVPAFLVFAVVPIGGDFSDGNRGVIRIFGHDTLMQVADPPVGVLWVLAMSGIAVYGIDPSPALAGVVDLRPALRLVSEVSHVHRVPAGEGISYGLRYAPEVDTTVATVPIGYADGVRRRLGGLGADVLVGGRRRPIAGTVTMDQITVDCGPDSTVARGDEVVSISRRGWGMPVDGLTDVKLDATRSADLDEVLRGADAVVIAVGSPGFDRNRLRTRVTASVVAAMRRVGLRRVVVHSSLGVGDSLRLMKEPVRTIAKVALGVRAPVARRVDIGLAFTGDHAEDAVVPAANPRRGDRHDHGDRDDEGNQLPEGERVSDHPVSPLYTLRLH